MKERVIGWTVRGSIAAAWLAFGLACGDGDAPNRAGTTAGDGGSGATGIDASGGGGSVTQADGGAAQGTASSSSTSSPAASTSTDVSSSASSGGGCRAGGETCESFSDCCSGTCANQVCTSCAGEGGPCSDGCCVGLSCYDGMCRSCRNDGVGCDLASDCCSNICTAGTCLACKDVGATCSQDEECCDGVCDGTCGGIPPECAPEAGDSACIECLKVSCCEETAACRADASCSACYACVNASGATACLGNGQCNQNNAATNDALLCGQTFCLSSCQ